MALFLYDDKYSNFIDSMHKISNCKKYQNKLTNDKDLINNMCKTWCQTSKLWFVSA